ncbi:MAG: methylmalonyl Co-A mutase-associated GTPase MeaB [Deltaproteobacteria bacterium]|nr:methylmalonyl Co-A mutase-associated GTPase MeaB [Deltaproteobacteria bacterium]
MDALLKKFLKHDRLALSRLVSVVENRSDQLAKIMDAIHDRVRNTSVLGITGPPGAGKSTLVNQLILQIRKKGQKVGVIAIDPSSPFSGGAVLGDRIRMQDHVGDEGVFIRSLGSRGAHGGLSRATQDIVRLFDAFGMDWVIVETVGVGQTEFDIMEIASTTVVVLTPESGDTVQTMKAGLLEVADIFVVNKADREGADKIVLELKSMVHMGSGQQNNSWEVPVLSMQAVNGVGISELFEQIEKHEETVRTGGQYTERISKIRCQEFKDILLENFNKQLEEKFQKDPRYLQLKQQVESGEMSPYTAASQLKV